VLQSLRSDKALDLGRLGVWLSTLLLGLHLSSDDELADIILLGQAEESSDLGGSLGAESLWVDNVGKTWDVLLTLLDDRQSENR